MGVMRCDREGCDSIMCDRCILESTAYICNSCWAELLECKRAWELPMSEAEVEQKIRDFMETPPGTYSPIEDGDRLDAVFFRLTGQERDSDA